MQLGKRAAMAESGSDSPPRKVASGHKAAAPDVPICFHGKLVLRVCKSGIHAGKSYLCCRLPREHANRCEHAFTWLQDTARGRAMAAGVHHPEFDDSEGMRGSCDGSNSMCAPTDTGDTSSAAGTELVASSRGPASRRAVVPHGGRAAEPTAERLSMRERLLAANQRAAPGRVVSVGNYEASRAYDSLRRMHGHGGHSPNSV